MYFPRRFRILVGLAIVAGCANDEVEVADSPDAETTNGSDDRDDESTGGSTNATTGDTDDGADEETDGGEGGPEWEPIVATDEIAVEQVPVLRPTQGRWPVAAFDGSQYLAVWEDHRRKRPILYGGRVGADGTALDPGGFPILDVDPASLDDSYHPSVASNGVDFLMVNARAGQILAVRVSGAGEVLDPGGILVADSAWIPSVAFDGEHYLVVWEDEGIIYRARVHPDGTVLDPGGVGVYSTSSDGTRVDVSFEGTHHLLVWEDYDVQLQSEVLNAGRVAPDGTPIDQVPILIHPIGYGNLNYTRWGAGFDGTNHVIAWTKFGVNDGWEEYQILASRVTPDGTVLDPEGILIFSDTYEAETVHRVDLAAGSGRSHVVWSVDYGGEGGPASRRVRVARLATDGTVSAYPEDTFARGLDGSVTVHPDGALLLWREGEDWWDDYPAITGTLLDGADVPVPDSVVVPAANASRQDVKAVASDGQNYFVIWTDTRDPQAEGKALYGGRVGAYGAPLDPEPILLSDWHNDWADVVFDGANYVVTWVHESGGEGDGAPYRIVRVSPAGERLDMEWLEPSLCSGDYDVLDGASDGTNTLLIGVDRESADNEFAALLLNQNGGSGDVIRIVDEGEGYAFDAAVSFAGLGYLVVWKDQDEVFGHMISQAGALEGTRFSLVDKDVWNLEMAAGGGIHLVLWDDFESGIWAMRVSPDGQVIDPGGFLVVAMEGVYGESSAAFDGENFIVAWRAPSVPDDESSFDLHAVRVSPDGEVSPQFEISQGPESEGRAFLAGADGRVLAAYTRFVPEQPYDTRRAMARLLVP